MAPKRKASAEAEDEQKEETRGGAKLNAGRKKKEKGLGGQKADAPKMEQQLALERDPDSLAFFNASKLANARNRKQPKGASVRAPKGAPAFNP